MVLLATVSEVFKVCPERMNNVDDMNFKIQKATAEAEDFSIKACDEELQMERKLQFSLAGSQRGETQYVLCLSEWLMKKKNNYSRKVVGLTCVDSLGGVSVQRCRKGPKWKELGWAPESSANWVPSYRTVTALVQARSTGKVGRTGLAFLVARPGRPPRLQSV